MYLRHLFTVWVLNSRPLSLPTAELQPQTFCLFICAMDAMKESMFSCLLVCLAVPSLLLFLNSSWVLVSVREIRFEEER